MESIKRPSTITLGHDLAFLYLNLGYITDGELSQEEIEKIVEKVEEWYQPTQTQEMAITIKESVDWAKSCGDKPGAEIEECAKRLKANLSEENLKAVLGDMAAIINADGKVVDGEVKFFAVIAKVFGIDLN